MPLPPPSPCTLAALLPQQGLLMLRFLLCRTLVLEATTHIYSVAVSVCSSVSWVALPPCLPPAFPFSLSLAACSVSPLSTVLCCQRQQPQFSFCCVSHFVCVCVSWVCHQLFPPQPRSLCPSSFPLSLNCFFFCSASPSPLCLLLHKFYFD